MSVDTNKLATIKQMLHTAQSNIHSAQELLSQLAGGAGASMSYASPTPQASRSVGSSGGKIIEGVFDGEMMIGPDGNRYPVPPNYASKSKLISGDLLKLTITETGSFVYKQIGPVERIQVIGVVKKLGNDFYVHTKGGEFRVLTASVTYFRAEPGDNVTVIVPAGSSGGWAAIENIIPGNVDVFAEDEVQPMGPMDQQVMAQEDDEAEDFETPESVQA